MGLFHVRKSIRTSALSGLQTDRTTCNYTSKKRVPLGVGFQPSFSPIDGDRMHVTPLFIGISDLTQKI